LKLHGFLRMSWQAVTSIMLVGSFSRDQRSGDELVSLVVLSIPFKVAIERDFFLFLLKIESHQTNIYTGNYLPFSSY
jgi:hypothetical protein